MSYPIMSRRRGTTAAFAMPGAARGNAPNAQTFIAHAMACLKAARQNLARAERELEGSTRSTGAMLTLVIEQIESLQHGAAPAEEPAVVAKDEEE